MQQVDQLKSALNQVIEHERCASKHGLCEHQYKGRATEKHDQNGRRIVEENNQDQGKDGEWTETMEEALAAEEDNE